MRVDLVDPSEQGVAEAVTKLLNGHNKTELARELNVSREQLYRWERGEAMPDLRELSALAQITDCEINLRFNPKSPDLEKQVRDLQRTVRRLERRDSALLNVIDQIAGEDVEIHESVEKIRTAMRQVQRIP